MMGNAIVKRGTKNDFDFMAYILLIIQEFLSPELLQYQYSILPGISE